MAWLWDSWEDYVHFVHPCSVPAGMFIQSRLGTRSEAERYLVEAAREVEEAMLGLGELGFGTKDRQVNTSSEKAENARDIVIVALRAGEELLLYNKRLAMSDAAYGFLHQRDLLEHWDRYAGTPRIPHELRQLEKDLRRLLEGHARLSEDDDRFITGDSALPKSLESDFRLARDLFSVGFDEVGLLIAGRGLEGVLRQIAHDKRITLEAKGKKTPASEADFHDLIETMSTVRWKTQNKPLISKQNKALLHYLRTIRNNGAHPGSDGSGAASARETAKVVAATAMLLWNAVSKNRARVDPITVQKNW